MKELSLREKTLWANGARELVIIGVICVFCWIASEKLNLFEKFYFWTRKTDWLDEVVIVGTMLALCLTVFSLRRWRELRIEIAERLQI